MKYREIYKVYNKVFDNQTFRNLKYMIENGFLKDDNLKTISEGKEAVVFLGRSYEGPVVVKIYKVMAISYRDQLKYLQADPRFRGVRRTRIEIIYNWAKREYSNLQRLYKYRVSVPMPIINKGNVFIMEFIGENETPAPKLKDALHLINDKEKFFKKILREYSKIYNKAQMVHGDFSEFNILYFMSKPYIIDVSQAILVSSPLAKEFFERDISNLERIAKKLRLKYTKEDIKKKILNYE